MGFFDRPVRAKKRGDCQPHGDGESCAIAPGQCIGVVSVFTRLCPSCTDTHRGLSACPLSDRPSDKSLGKKTVNFEMSEIPASVNMEVPKVSRPTMSADKMTRKLEENPS